jgi:hypothetical protein
VLCFGSLCWALDRCARDRCAVLRIAVLGFGSLCSGSLCCAWQRWVALGFAFALIGATALVRAHFAGWLDFGGLTSPRQWTRQSLWSASTSRSHPALSSPSFSCGSDLCRAPNTSIKSFAVSVQQCCLSRATRSGSPSRLSAPSWARPVPRSCEWKGCRYRRSGRRSGRIEFLKRVDDQIATQSAIHSDPTREDHCSRA